MLQSISWGDYISSLCFILVVYYVIIVSTYYRKELLNLFGIKTIEPDIIPINSLAEFNSTAKDEEAIPKLLPDVDITPLVRSFIDEVRAYLQEAANYKIVKQEVLYALQQIFAKYPVLNTAESKASLLQEVYEITTQHQPGVFKPEELKSYLSL